MEVGFIRKLCDADFRAISKTAQGVAKETTITECEEIYRRANEKGDVSDARNETDEQAV